MIGDIVSKVIIEVKGDTTDIKSKIKDLVGEEQKLAKAQLDQANARNAQLDKWVKGIGTVTIALGAVTAAGAALFAGWEHNARKAQLSSNVFAGDIERLRKGFGGLRSEMQALEVVNSLSRSKFKLTGDQMETVGKAMRQLVREGHSWEDVTKKVTDAFVKLNVSGLDDFGLHAREAKTDAEKFAVALELMAGKAGKVSGETKTQAEQVQSLRTRWADMFETIKSGLGDVASTLLTVAEGLKKVAHTWREVPAASWADIIDIGRMAKDRGVSVEEARRQFNAEQMYMRDMDENLDAAKKRARGGGYSMGNAADDFGLFTPPSAARTGRGGGYGGNVASATGPISLGATSFGGGGQGLGSAALTGDEFGRDIMSTIDLSKYGRGQNVADEYTQYQRSKLAEMFGPIDEFDAYKSAFEGLTTVVQGSFSAWIDGSMSAGAAFKKMVGEVLKANAVQLMGEAIKHGVYAVGSLAFGDFRGAAQHGTAAAKALAGAAAMGVLAKGIIGGGSSGGAGASAPGGGVPAYTGGGQQQGGSQTIVVAYGQDFTQDTARQRQLRAARILEDARQMVPNNAVGY